VSAPEQQLLLGACLWRGDKAVGAWRAWQEKVDWNAHLDTESYDLLPLLFHNLSRHNVEHPMMQKLKGVYRKRWFTNSIAMGELASLLQKFNDAGLRTMTMKAAAMAVLYQPNGSLRPLKDFDLVVSPKEVPDSISVLQNLGWQSEWWVSRRPMGILLETQRRLVFAGSENQRVNLYWHVIQESRSPDADEPFWGAAIVKDINGVPAYALDPTDQLFQICVESGPAGGWVADAMTIINFSSPEIDWNRLITHARKRFLFLRLRTALTYLHDLFGAAIPESVLTELNRRSVSRMERWEARYLASGYRSRRLGDIPFFWFDYLRSRRLSSDENTVRGFVRYLQWRAESPSLPQLPLHLASACYRRVFCRRA